MPKKYLKYRSERGAGLLQIMLLIVIIAAFGVYAAMGVKIRAQNIAVGKATVEIENWLQASMEFLLKFRRWPDTPAELYQNAVHITQNQICSPWHTSNGTAYCNGKSEYQFDRTNTSAGYFGIAVETPSPTIAQQVMAQLPIAKVENNKVIAYVSIPGAPTADPNSLLMKGVYTIESGNGVDLTSGNTGVTIKLPVCPPNWRPDYELSLSQYYIVPWGPFRPTIINTVGVNKNQIDPHVSKANTAYIVVDYSGANSFSGKMTVFTFCVPPGYYNGNDANLLAQNGV